MKLDKAPPTSSTSNTWRVGDWVEVRSLAEILETLDEQAALNAMPFMPEMAPYCGKRFRILKVSHKTCDSSGWYYLRTLRDSVHLDLRCDGSYHDGCQAGCLFFWKTAWLRKADGPLPDNRERAKREEGLFPETLKNSTCRESENGTRCYRCQATEIKNATEPLKPWQLSQYIHDLKSHNVTPYDFVRYAILAFTKTIKVQLVSAKNFLKNAVGYDQINKANPLVSAYKHLKHTFGFRPLNEKSLVVPPLNLMPGDKVRIKSLPEIKATLNSERKNFGLSFEGDMAQYCGTTQEVVQHVERIIDERTGEMLNFSTASVILKDVICTGLYCRVRLFCPRGQRSFWRDAWLEKIPSKEETKSR